MYAKIVDGQVVAFPYTYNQLRADNPGTSFPESMPEERLAEWSVLPVLSGTPPAPEPGHTAVETNPVQQEDGRWVQAWEVRPCTPEEQEQKAAQMRSIRTRLLAESDWTQLPDSPIDREAWGAYRQALRDVTAQPGFPWAVDWPVPPT